jgi:hypothetical protein
MAFASVVSKSRKSMGLVRKSNAPRFIAVRMLDIADALSMQIQRLNELYAETNQVGFIGRWETDGAPVLEEAFVRVKLA